MLSLVQTGHHQTSSMKQTIIDLTLAMKADFGALYASVFKDPEDLREFKNRLLTRLKGVDPVCLTDGYEQLLEADLKYPPTAQEIIKSAIEVKRKRDREQREREAIESKKLEPPPTMTVEPLKLLSEAKEEKPEITFQDRAKAHEALIKTFDAQGKIRRTPYHMSSGCASFGCKNPGTVSSSLRGTDTWYCMSCRRKLS